MMLIDAEARLKEIETAKQMWFGSGEAKAHYIEKLECAESWIANAPKIDAVPVVRCNMCKYYEQDTGFCQCFGTGNHWDGFCNFGKAKTNKDTKAG